MQSGQNGFRASSPAPVEIGPAYLQLALQLDRWIPGLVQQYQGPTAWKQDVRNEGLSLEVLRQHAVALATAVQRSSLKPNRRERLLRLTRALLWLIREQLHENIIFSEQVRLLLDLKAESVDDEFFEQAHETLRTALPVAEGTLPERWSTWKAAYTRPAAEVVTHIANALAYLQENFDTGARIGPIEVILTSEHDEPHYRDNVLYVPEAHSVRVDRVCHLAARTYATHLLNAAYAERYAGGQGEMEYGVVLAHGPDQVLVQGLPHVLLERVEPYSSLLPKVLHEAGLPNVNNERLRAIHMAEAMLEWAYANTALLLHSEKLRPRAVRRRIMSDGLLTRTEAEQAMQSLQVPRQAAHVFAPLVGGPLIQAWLEQKGNTLAHLLEDPPVPSAMLFEIRFQS